MRSPPTPSGFDRTAFECRVRFSGRLQNAVIQPLDEAPAPPAPPVQNAPPPPTAAPAASPLPAPPASAAPPSPPNPADFWKTDLARELTADRKRIEEVLVKLQAASSDLRRDQTERLQQWQRAAVELAMTIATRLLHERLVSGDFPMEVKVRDMVQQLEGEAPAAVRLNPADLQLLKSRLGDEPLLPGQDDPRLIPDATLARGDCRVEGKEAMLLSEISRELQEIRDELLRSLAHARS